MISGCTREWCPFGEDKFHVSFLLFSVCSLNYKSVFLLNCLAYADTMMKFASYENIVEMIYKHVVPTPKNDCSKSLQLGVSVVGGYLAGILCAVVSHPADNLVSFLNSSNGATVADVSLHRKNVVL